MRGHSLRRTWGWLACVSIAAGCGFTAPANGVPDDGGVDAALPPAVVEFAAAMSTEDEMSGPVQVLVTLSRPATSTITVPYRIVDNTGAGWATPGADFIGADGTLTFNPGDEIKGIDLTIIDDSADEENEKIQLELQAPTGDATLGATTSHTVTISAFVLPRVGFMTAAATGNESTANVQLTLTLTAVATTDVTVGYTVTGDAETMSTDFPDHNLVAGSIVIPAGMMSVAIPVTVADDAYDEDDEHLVVTLASSLNAVVDQTKAAHDYTIVDNDPAPALTFQTASVMVDRDEADADVTLVAELSVRSEKTVSVSFGQNTNSVTFPATIATDFSYTTPTMLTWAAGTTTLTKNIVVHIIDDELDEEDEIIETVFSAPMNVSVAGTVKSTLTITNVDAPSSVGFSTTTPSISVTETDADLTRDLLVVLDKPSAKAITVMVATSGTANHATTSTPWPNNSDWTTRAGDIPVSFAPGDTMKTIRVIIRGDNRNDADSETAILTLSSATNATINSDENARTITIVDDD